MTPAIRARAARPLYGFRVSPQAVTPRPDRITRRSDAVQLWLHLLERGIVFTCEEDPAEWLDDAGQQVLALREIATVRRLFGEVDRLGAETFDCYADAVALGQLALLGALPRPVACLAARSRRKAAAAPELVQEELRFAA